MDYKSLYYLIREQWTESVDGGNLDSILQLIVSDLAGLHENSLPAEQVTELRGIYSVLIKQIVSTRKITQDRNLFVLANNLLSLMVKDIAAQLQFVLEANLEHLVLLFKSSENFFDVRHKHANESIQFQNVDGVYAQLHERERNLYSVFWAIHINTFGESGGFTTLLKELNITSSIKFIKDFLSFFLNIRGPLNKNFLTDVADSYKVIFQKLNGFEEEQLKTVSKQDVSSIVNNLECLMKESGNYTDSFVSETTENFCLDFSLKCFQSTFLEKRHHGLTYIEEAVTTLSRSFHIGSSFKWIQKKNLCDWIIKHKLIEMLFDIKNTRDELIKRGKCIITFIAEEDALTEEHFDLMWQCSMDKYLSVNTFDVLQAVSEKNGKFTRVIWEKLVNLPQNEWTPELVKLSHALYVFAKRSSQNSPLSVLEIFKFYEKMISEDSLVGPNVMRLILDEISTIICDKSAVIGTTRLICEELLSTGLTPQIAYLLSKIFDTINGVEQFILELDQEYHLLELAVNQLCSYKEKLIGLLKEEFAHCGSKALDSFIDKRFSYKHALTFYLNLMNLIIEKAGPALHFSAEDIDKLWSNFIDGNTFIFKEEQDIFYEWLKKLCSRVLVDNKRAISSDNVLTIFHKLCTQNSEKILDQGFECFRSYFVAANIGSIKLIGDKDGSTFVITKYENYKGRDALQEITLVVESERIFKQFVDLYIRIFTRFTEDSRDMIPQIHKEFIDIILDRIISSVTSEKTEQNIKDINRSTFILDQFLQSTKTAPTLEKVSNNEEKTKKSSLIEYRSEHERGEVQQFREVMGCTEMMALLAIRKYPTFNSAIQHALDEPEVLMEEEERMISGSEAQVEQPKEVESTSEYIPPSNYISSVPKYFDCLLALLEEKSINKSFVWEIVNSLPPNKLLENMLLELENVNYDELFDINSSFKLQYTLQIVDGFMKPKSEKPTEEQINQSIEWHKKFIDRKAFEHLVSLILKIDLNSHVPTTNSSLLLVFKIIDHFLNQRQLNGLVSSFNFTHLLEPLIQITSQIVTQSSSGIKEKVHQELVELSVRLISTIVSEHPELLQVFYSSPVDTKKLIVESLRCSNEIAVACKNGYHKICSEWKGVVQGVQNPVSFFNDLLVAHYPFNGSHVSDSYYDLVANIFILNGPLEKEKSSLRQSKSESFFLSLISAIQSSDGDLSESSAHRSNLLVGSLNVMKAYIIVNPGQKQKVICYNLIQQIFDICMSPNDDIISTLKCLTRESRKAAFDLLLELASDNEKNYQLLISLLTPCIQIPTKEERSKVKTLAKTRRGQYVGLSNLGCTCFANSVMQQFYMIPSFRKEIFECKTEKKMVAEVKKMFAFLQESKREFYDTKDFMDSVSDLINIRQQQDVYEFFQQVYERFETQFVDDNKTQQLTDSFRVELQTEIVCSLNPEHRSIGSELTVAITVDVKKGSLHGSLKEFFEGEKIQNYKCDKCKTDVEITRSYSVKKLPTTLFVHLKRFEWSIDSNKKLKVCDRFEYPFQIDMKQYMSKEAAFQKDEDYQYALVGVIVHTGGAESGHYYSFIQDRVSDAWSRFDDNYVSDFDITNLPSETFGEKKEEFCRHPMMSSGNQKIAYMLVYEQVNHKNEWKDIISKNPVICPPESGMQIKSDNSNFIRLRLRFDSVYYDFLEKVVSALTFPPVTKCEPTDFIFQTLQKVTRFVFEMSSDFTENQHTSWMTSLIGHYKKHAVACRWLLNILCTSKKEWLIKNLLENSERFMRRSFEELLMTCVIVLENLDREKEYTGPIPVLGVYQGKQKEPSDKSKILALRQAPTANYVTPTVKYPQFSHNFEKLKNLEDNEQQIIVSTLVAIISKILEDPENCRNLVLATQKLDSQVVSFLVHVFDFKNTAVTSSKGPVIVLQKADVDLFKYALSEITTAYKNTLPPINLADGTTENSPTDVTDSTNSPTEFTSETIAPEKPAEKPTSPEILTEKTEKAEKVEKATQIEKVEEKSENTQKIEGEKEEKVFTNFNHLSEELPMEELEKENIPLKFIAYLLSLVEESRAHARKFNQYWNLISRAFEIQSIRRFMMKCKLDAIMIDQYMGEMSPLWDSEKHYKRHSINSDMNITSLEEFMWVFVKSLVACHTETSKNFPEDYQPKKIYDEPLYTLDDFSYKNIYSNNRVLDSVLSVTCYNLKANEMLMRHLAWENPILTRVFIRYFSEYHYYDELRNRGFSSDDTLIEKLKKENSVFSSLFQIEDSYAPWRISTLLDPKRGFIYMLSQAVDKKIYQKLLLMLTHLRQWVTEIPLVAGFLRTVGDELLEIIINEHSKSKEQRPPGKLGDDLVAVMDFFLNSFLNFTVCDGEEKNEISEQPFPEKFEIPPINLNEKR